MRVKRYIGELQRRKRERYRLKRFLQRKRIKHTVVDIFYNVFLLLKEQNKEAWAARVIGKWWRREQIKLRQLEKERWLPLNIDPDTANFDDVGRVLKVLDDYALRKLAKMEDEPLLPNIIRIQRFVKRFLVTTRLKRCTRDGIKFIKMMKAMAAFELRSQRSMFFYQHEMIWREDIEKLSRKRQRRAARLLRKAAGENVSDSSSVKEQRQKQKAKYLAEIKRAVETSPEVLKEKKLLTLQQAQLQQAKALGKNLTTIRKSEAAKEAKRFTSKQKQLKKARAAALKLAEL